MEDNVNPYASPAELEGEYAFPFETACPSVAQQPAFPKAIQAAEPGTEREWAEGTPPADLPAPEWVVPYATARTRATWAVLFLAAVLLANLASAGSSWLQIELLERMKLGDFTAEEATWNDAREGLVALFLAVAFIGSAISFLMWFHRAHRNLPALGATGLRFTPGWAVGWWFIPVFSLFRPYQVMKEIWRGSHPATRPGAEESPWPPPSTALVGWWWALFLFMTVTSQIALQVAGHAESIDEWIMASWLDISDCLITVPAALVAILVVRRLMANQEERVRLLTQENDSAA